VTLVAPCSPMMAKSADPRSALDGPMVVAWHRLGPYHHARLRAAARRLPIVGLEVSTVDPVNAWAPVENAEGFRRVRLFEGVDVDAVPFDRLRRTVSEELGRLRPAAVAVHGWATRDALVILEWAAKRAVPVIVMSESSALDTPRNPLREYAKRQILRLAASALVGGTLSADYVRRLGIPGERIALGYDAVDNAYFAAGAAAARHRQVALRSALGLPDRFFLASARFVAKKNLAGLIAAYGAYRDAAGERAWKLVILGDGELRHPLEELRAGLGLAADVLMPGFKQYGELPVWYGLASCFVHASIVEQWGLVVNEAMASGLPVLVSDRCGCAADLVKDSVNGFTFNPYDVASLAALMHRVAHGDVDRTTMGQASREIIADWGPERFAAGLFHAVAAALASPRRRTSLADHLLLRVLTRR
jgi:1,2-diacylglycerol 3-alpha-glucosyltransferase